MSTATLQSLAHDFGIAAEIAFLQDADQVTKENMIKNQKITMLKNLVKRKIVEIIKTGQTQCLVF